MRELDHRLGLTEPSSHFVADALALTIKFAIDLRDHLNDKLNLIFQAFSGNVEVPPSFCRAVLDESLEVRLVHTRDFTADWKEFGGADGARTRDLRRDRPAF